jgi:hypothetical protein
LRKIIWFFMDPLMRYVQYQGKTILASKGTFLLKKVLSCELLAIFSLILDSTSKDFLKPQVKAEDVNGRVDTVLEELRATRNEVSSLRS